MTLNKQLKALTIILPELGSLITQPANGMCHFCQTESIAYGQTTLVTILPKQV